MIHQIVFRNRIVKKTTLNMFVLYLYSNKINEWNIFILLTKLCFYLFYTVFIYWFSIIVNSFNNHQFRFFYNSRLSRNGQFFFFCVCTVIEVSTVSNRPGSCTASDQSIPAALYRLYQWWICKYVCTKILYLFFYTSL